MAQQEIMQLLEKNGEMTTKELSEILGICPLAVRTNLRRLLKVFEVDRRALSKEEAVELGKRFTGRNFVWFLYKGKVE